MKFREKMSMYREKLGILQVCENVKIKALKVHTQGKRKVKENLKGKSD